MANYNVNKWTSSVAPLVDTIEELEIRLETIDSTKKIHTIGVVQVGNNTQTYLITDV